MVKLYSAPLEGVTGYVWRKAHREVFGGADKYFAPFISPNQNAPLQSRDIRELGNGEKDLVPQILTNRADYFIPAAEELHKMGYDEVNLNLGCPSGTVTPKYKGSGMLRDTELLDRMLYEIFSADIGVNISVKTRIGYTDLSEWPKLVAIFEKYPIYELTVHPRLKSELYGGTAHRDIFAETLRSSKLNLVYNGDVVRSDDEALTYGCPVMAGRGICENPALFRMMRGGKSPSKEEFAKFHSKLMDGYAEYMSGDTPLIHRMRETWSYMRRSFADSDDTMKRMAKAKKLEDYISAAEEMMNCPVRCSESRK